MDEERDMRLSDRLQAIADLIPKNTIVADIGTDHGYIPIYLIEKGISKRVIATDISGNSLNKIVESIEGTRYRRDIDARIGDGLEPIKPFEVDTVVIAGMGGLLIRDILDGDKYKRDSIVNFILQPNVAAKELRMYLYENNFRIVDEVLVKEDNRFYEVILAERGKAYVEGDIYYEVGERLLSNADPLLKEFIYNRIDIKEGILRKLERKETQRSIDRRRELIENIDELRMVLDEIEGN